MTNCHVRPSPRRWSAVLFMATSAVLLSVGSAHAQLVAPRDAAPVTLGPVSLYPQVRMIDSGRDSNVFRDSANPQEDYTATVSSRVMGVTKFGANELLFSSGSDYVWFQRFASERSNNAHSAARLNLAVSRFEPFVGASYVASTSRPSPEIDARVRRVERAAEAGVSLQVADRTAILASARFEHSTYGDDEVFRGVALGEPLNRTGRTLSGGIRYEVTPLTSLVLTGDYGEDVFPDSHQRDAKSYSINPTLVFSPDAAIRGQVTAGFESFRPKAEGINERRGAVYAAALTWTMFGRTSVGLQGSRNVGYSYLDSEQYYLWTTAHIEITQPIFGPVDILGDVEWDRLEYLSPAGGSSLSGQRIQMNRGGGGVGISLGRGVRMTLTAERTVRNSSFDLRRNFRATRVMSSITVGS